MTDNTRVLHTLKIEVVQDANGEMSVQCSAPVDHLLALSMLNDGFRLQLQRIGEAGKAAREQPNGEPPKLSIVTP